MRYNTVTRVPSLQLAQSMTNEELQQLIATLITDFIRPNAQQHLESMARMDRIESALERQAEVVAELSLKLDQTATQQQANAQQIAQNAEAITRFDTGLEETRLLVAQNASDVAQSNATHTREMAELRTMQEANAQQIADNAQLIADNAQQVTALAEASRTQLAALIGNGRRIDRLEQQAS